MLTVLIFIVLIGLLVFVHELGHFITARRNGIRADEFGFGFPPRAIGVYKDDATGVWRMIIGERERVLPRFLHALLFMVPLASAPAPSEEKEIKNTIYSLNWIPLGGFVRIHGEGGESKADPESFAGKSAWVRVKVLGAGVVMNFLFAWFLISLVLMLGLPQPISPEERAMHPDAKIQIINVVKDSPAATMGLQMGDEVVAINGGKTVSLEMASQVILAHKGEVIHMDVNRFGKPLTLSGTPRVDYPKNEGALGISFSETAVISYPWYQAIYQGAITTYNITIAIFAAFGTMIASLFGGAKAPLDVTGPVGIVYLTKQMSDLGFAYLLQFAAILSINLGIINILPIPALDGGRILFILIEKLKGSPVSQRVESMIHQVGFMLLLLLMLLVTIRDFSQFHILTKITSFF